MKILCKKRLREYVPYSLVHITRLEKRGLFPQRIQLGACRVGWLENEVLEWIAEKAKQRVPLTPEE